MRINRLQGFKLKRLEAGLTLEETANRTGLTKQSISGYETGRYIPTTDKLKAFAELFGCNVFELFGKGIFVFEDLEPTSEEDWETIRKYLK